MQQVPFAALPVIARVAVVLAYFLGWVAFAEIIIDRNGWSAWLPYYRVGAFCPYDAAVGVILLGVWLGLHRRGGA